MPFIKNIPQKNNIQSTKVAFMNTIKLSAIIFLSMGIAGLHAAQHVLTQDEEKYVIGMNNEVIQFLVAEYAKDHNEEKTKLFYDDLLGQKSEKIAELMLKAAEKELGDEINVPEEGKIVVCDSDDEDEAEDIELPLSETAVLTNDLAENDADGEEQDNQKPQPKSFFEKLCTRYATAKSGLYALSWPTKAAVGAGLAAIVVVIMQLIKKK